MHWGGKASRSSRWPGGGLAPQEIALPSVVMAAKQRCEAWMHSTRRSGCTRLLSPPWPGEPQVTTVPSLRMAAKALCDALMARTSCNWARTASESPPSWSQPQVTTD